jgi:hypothetical protein
LELAPWIIGHCRNVQRLPPPPAGLIDLGGKNALDDRRLQKGQCRLRFFLLKILPAQVPDPILSTVQNRASFQDVVCQPRLGFPRLTWGSNPSAKTATGLTPGSSQRSMKSG